MTRRALNFLRKPAPGEAPVQGDPLRFAAYLAARVLSVDEKWATEEFTRQVEHAGGLQALGITGEQDITVGVTVGAKDSSGEELTPHRVLRGHDSITATRSDKAVLVPETYVLWGIHEGCPDTWWNRRMPESMQDCQIISDPLVILSLSALRGRGKKWSEQRAILRRLSHTQSTERTVTVGATPTDWMLGDAGRVILGEQVERLDETTFAQFIQHDIPPSGFGEARGLWARVRDGHAELGEMDVERPWSNAGFRSVTGPRQQQS